MAFGKPKDRQEPFLPRPIDMKELQRRMEDGTRQAGSPQDYAPPSIREAQPPVVVDTFGELPTDEIDEIVKAAKAELVALEKDGEEIKAMYLKHIARVRADYERLRNGMKLSMDTFKLLREQCLALDTQPQPEYKKPKIKEISKPETKPENTSTD